MDLVEFLAGLPEQVSELSPEGAIPVGPEAYAWFSRQPGTEGLYRTPPSFMQEGGKHVVPFGRQFVGETPWLSTETAMETAMWLPTMRMLGIGGKAGSEIANIGKGVLKSEAGFVGSPKGLKLLNKPIKAAKPVATKPIQEILGMKSPEAYIQSLPIEEKAKLYENLQQIVASKKAMERPVITTGNEIQDIIRSEVQKVIRPGKKGPSRKGGGLLDFLKDERGLVGKDINRPLMTRQGEIEKFRRWAQGEVPGERGGFTKHYAEEELTPEEKLVSIFRETPEPTGPSRLKPSYPAKSAKEMFGSDLVAEIAEKGYSPQIRAKILARFATTPERAELISKTAPQIERIKEAAGPGSRGYIMGSFASTKPNPSDIDLLVRIGTPESTGALIDLANKSYIGTGKSLHPLLVGNVGSYRPPVSKVRIPSTTQGWRNKMRRRYPGSQMIRLWSGLPVGVGLADLLQTPIKE